MGEFLSISLVGGLVMGLLYLAYRIFLANDNQPGFNRLILLIIYGVSFLVAPGVLMFDKLHTASISAGRFFEGAGFATVGGSPDSKPVWGTILIWLFIVGMVIVAVKTGSTWIRLIKVIHRGQKTEGPGYKLVLTDNEKYAPFSWMHYVVISKGDYEKENTVIIDHELQHVSSRHWIDLLIAQLVCICNWFNPAAWLMHDELMLIHEYQADMAVIGRGHDPGKYQMLLIKKAVGSRFPSLANSLNHSKLKKRITMMYKEKSGTGQKFKALVLVPVLALALGVTAVPAVRAAVSTIENSEASVGKNRENPSTDQIGVQVYKVISVNDNGVFNTVVLTGSGFGNNITVSGGTFTNNGKTYNAKSLQCDMSEGHAFITATFPFTGEEYKNPSMTFMINGEEIPFDLTSFFEDSLDVASEPRQESYNQTLQIQTPEMEYFLNGKKIDMEVMAKISPENIASITVDKQTNTIRISTE